MTIKIENPKIKEQIIQRLSRIEGQIRGVQKMISEDRDCKEIIQQLLAVRSAVQSASLNFMEGVATECLLSQDDQQEPEALRETLVDLIKMLSKLTG